MGSAEPWDRSSVPTGFTPDGWRTARLLFAAELRAGRIDEQELLRPEVRAAVAGGAIPRRPVRVAQRLQRRLGHGSRMDPGTESAMRARRAVLGADAPGTPRVLVRMDEFPHYEVVDESDRFGTARFRTFHEILGEAGVPYLIAVLPRPSHAPLDPTASGDRSLTDDERELLRAAAADGTAFALHGLDHRTRDAHPRRHSELLGRSDAEVQERVERALAELADLDLDLRTFVAPYNRFEVSHYDVLARRFDIVTGGEESILRFGWQRTPRWRGDAVYLPSYAPAYERAEVAAAHVERLAARGVSAIVPVTLHWGWEEGDDFASLRRAVRVLGRHALRWQDFLTDVEGSR